MGRERCDRRNRSGTEGTTKKRIYGWIDRLLKGMADEAMPFYGYTGSDGVGAYGTRREP